MLIIQSFIQCIIKIINRVKCHPIKSNNNSNKIIDFPSICVDVDIYRFVSKLYRLYNIQPQQTLHELMNYNESFSNSYYDSNTKMMIDLCNNNNSLLQIDENISPPKINKENNTYFGLYSPIEIDYRNKYLSQIQCVKSVIETPTLQLNCKNISISSIIPELINNIDSIPTTYVLETLIQALNDTSINVKIAACTAISNYRELALPVLSSVMQLIDDKNPLIRSLAIRTIGLMGRNVINVNPLIYNKILNCLNDTHWSVRFSSCLTLCIWGNINYSSINLIIEGMKHKKIKPQLACEILINGGEKCINKLIEMYKDKTLGSQIRVSIIISLSHFPSNTSIKIIDKIISLYLLALEDYDSYIQANAIISLGNLQPHNNNIPLLNPRFLMPILYKKLKDPREIIQKAVSYSLIMMGNAGEYLLIEGVLRDKNPQIRKAALNGIISIGPEMIRILLTLILDGNTIVQQKAGEAILEWGSQKCINSIDINYINETKSLIQGILTNHPTLSLNLLLLLQQIQFELDNIK